MAGTFEDIREGGSRFSDVLSGPRRRLPPIHGFEDKPLLPLADAVKPIMSLVLDVLHMIYIIEDSCKQPKDGLSSDESAAIMLYTLEWAPSEKSFYFILNSVLRSEDRRKLAPWFSYLRLIVYALSKLPSSSPNIIYRGIKLDLSAEYIKGKELVWWPFSSCTATIETLETHIGRTGKRTMFNIICRAVIDISRHSYYQTEKELLLYPGRQFKVRSLFDAGNDLHIIELEEIEPPFSLFRMPTVVKPNTDKSINILLIGEQGVGKSTFINAFVNYLTFKTVEEVKSNQPVVLKPLSFDMTTNYNFEPRTVTFGNFHQAIAQGCHTYTFNLNQNDGKKLCLIDTPSFIDAQEFNQMNSNNIKHILDYVNNLTHLNAVCFLLKPDSSQLLDSFQLCFVQLLNRLGSNGRKNVIFCFTHARGTFYMLGNTGRLLKNLFTSYSMNDIAFHRTNTFFLDSESFRYFVAVQNGIKFSNEDKDDYIRSWSASVNESKRLLDYICTQLIPCSIVKK